jgi:hypothetical protein
LPHIYEKFRELALVKLNAGFKKYSARTIVERMRWDYELPTTGDPFKINDDFVPIYARLLIYHEPRFTDFFELRQVRSQGQKSKEQLMREAVV